MKTFISPREKLINAELDLRAWLFENISEVDVVNISISFSAKINMYVLTIIYTENEN